MFFLNFCTHVQLPGPLFGWHKRAPLWVILALPILLTSWTTGSGWSKTTSLGKISNLALFNKFT